MCILEIGAEKVLVLGVPVSKSGGEVEETEASLTLVYNTSSSKSALQEAPIISTGVNSDMRRDNNRFRHIFGGESMIRP